MKSHPKGLMIKLFQELDFILTWSLKIIIVKNFKTNR